MESWKCLAHSRQSSLVFVAAIFLLFSGRSANSTDWPQWRGPARDGHAAEQPVLQSWPPEGPSLIWQSNSAGAGYSSLAVSGDNAYTLGKRDKRNVLIAYRVLDGRELWATEVGPSAEGNEYSTGWGDGPRSTPTIDGSHIYVLTDLGDVACVEKLSGSKMWSKNLVRDFQGSIPDWGYSESILIDGDRLIVSPGGKNFMIGLNKRTGEKIWESQYSQAAQYSSVIKHQFQDIPLYISASKEGLVAIHAISGETQFVHAATGNGTAVIPTPIAFNDLVYHTSAYQAGSSAVRLELHQGIVKATPLYHEKKDSMENHHGGVVLKDGVIFGFSKSFRGVWMAQDVYTGKVLWTLKIGKSTSGSIACADGLLFCYDDQEGTCYLVKPAKDQWQQMGKLTIKETTDFDRKRGAIWSHPVIAQGMLFIRDQEKIFVYRIAR